MTASPRIFVGGLAHETHTFSNIPTRIDDFLAYEWAESNDIERQYRGTRTSIGGAYDGAERHNATIVPGFYAFAIPSGLVPHDDYVDLRARFLASLRAAMDTSPIDAVLLICHGAMVVEGVADMELDLAEHTRAVIGPGLPLAMTVDFHANVSADLVGSVDLLDGYDTYPHVDVYERGYEAAGIVAEMVTSGVRLSRAYASIPILSVPPRQGTDAEPMRSLLARVHEIEGTDPAVRCISLLGGFCYSDVPKAGMSVVVQMDQGHAEQASAYARELQMAVWNRRSEFIQSDIPVAEAVSHAMASQNDRPTMLVDVADNVGGGTPGDGTALLREILDRGMTGAVVAIADPEAVQVAIDAGIGGAFQAQVGGKTDDLHGSPVAIEGTVRLLSDGEFVYRGSYMTGQRKYMGRTAVIDVQGNSLIVSERKTMPFDQEQLRSVGISPEYAKAIVVKSATGWRAAYAEMCGDAIDVDAPGICTANLSSLDYANVSRPIFPLDDVPNGPPPVSYFG